MVPRELKVDTFSTLILQGGTNEVSNLDVSGISVEKIEALKEEIKVSSEKLFYLAEQSLAGNKNLENVIIFKRMFRCDILKNDSTQIKNNLSEFGNRVLEDIWLSKGCPKNIQIVQQALECKGELRISRFGFPSAQGYDCIHMRGKLAVQHYTRSVIDALLGVMPNFSSKQIINPEAPTFAKNVRNNIPFQQFQFNQYKQAPKSRVRQGQPTFSFAQAQPQLGKTFAQMSGQYASATSQHNKQNRQKFVPSPATGVNRIALGGNQTYFNVKTQNRFSPVSGN